MKIIYYAKMVDGSFLKLEDTDTDIEEIAKNLEYVKSMYKNNRVLAVLSDLGEQQ